ncbi:hypothetical protein, partial [Ureibacillus sinduriensis]
MPIYIDKCDKTVTIWIVIVLTPLFNSIASLFETLRYIKPKADLLCVKGEKPLVKRGCPLVTSAETLEKKKVARKRRETA